ncbi:BlaI/MecI/CopY family transcriptional regulator [Acidipropionibacterium timonense]|uniref:BlaI/MecI/CopY family transcriptional regulator n=1 Tax=Acidipropionibacterium timonense TaxID=2161818 RepID=UPI0010322594|nr:BlaI/MecI/CopY family transcriptional regulator [Acidipropionibacterium timonense]
MAVLGDLEHRIMEVLWSSPDDMSVRDVHEVLVRDGKIAYTTVMTVLDRLTKKHVVRRRQEQRAWLYRPASTKARFLAGEMLQVLDEAGRDRPAVLTALATLLTPEERDAVRSG